MPRPLHLLLCVATVACSDPFPPPPNPMGTSVDITTDRTVYGPSDSSIVTVRNLTGQAMQFNLCPGALQRWTGSTWATVDAWPGPGAAACALIGGALSPNATYSARFTIHAGAGTGSYRFEFFAIEMGNQLPIGDRVSHQFEVR